MIIIHIKTFCHQALWSIKLPVFQFMMLQWKMNMVNRYRFSGAKPFHQTNSWIPLCETDSHWLKYRYQYEITGGFNIAWYKTSSSIVRSHKVSRRRIGCQSSPIALKFAEVPAKFQCDSSISTPNLAPSRGHDETSYATLNWAPGSCNLCSPQRHSGVPEAICGQTRFRSTPHRWSAASISDLCTFAMLCQDIVHAVEPVWSDHWILWSLKTGGVPRQGRATVIL